MYYSAMGHQCLGQCTTRSADIGPSWEWTWRIATVRLGDTTSDMDYLLNDRVEFEDMSSCRLINE